MPTISLCMIVKNEEEVLGRCLDQVKDIADEIIVADTGSKDRTREIALSYTDQLYTYQWKDDFADARNFSFQKASMDYCMWLDADDVITENAKKALLAWKKESKGDEDVVMMKYHAAFDRQNRPVFSYYRERLLKREKHFQWKGMVHEVIEPSGKTVYMEEAIEHRKVKAGDGDRNLRIYENALSRGYKLNAREQFYYGRELLYHGRKEEAVKVLEGFLEEPSGWMENKIDCCCLLFDCGQGPEILFKTFSMDVPRAEVCCRLGWWWMEKQQWNQAAWWYEAALRCESSEKNGAFYQADCYTYLPHIQLCACFSRMGQLEKAYEHHVMAAGYKPESEVVKKNNEYFKNRLGTA